MKQLFRWGLTQRILGLILAGITASAVVEVIHSERIFEGAMLAQAKKQALVYLYGIERQIRALPDPFDRTALGRLVEKSAWHHADDLDFSLLALYLFDDRGHILAHSDPIEFGDKPIDADLRATLRGERDPLAEEVEYYTDPATGRELPKADIVLPVRFSDGRVLALEIEIKLDETLALVRIHDDKYEEGVIVSVLVTGLATLLFIAWVIRRGLIAPIHRLNRVTAAIAAGALESRAEGVSNDELGSLARGVNQMADSIQALLDEQEQAYIQMLQSLTKALEAKDAYTAGHSGRVAKYSVKLAHYLGLPEEKLDILKRGALLHDLGKIGIPDAVLNKPGPLTEAEYEEIQRHPVFTATILRPLKRFKDHADIAAWHHERWDGHGYPDGLAGESIPLLARIVAIADTWDAMTGDRIYRKGMAAEKALAILEQERDQGQFDPQLIDAFIAMMRDELSIHARLRRDMFPPAAAAS